MLFLSISIVLNQVKEQTALALHFVNKEDCVIERFQGTVHASHTTFTSLKLAIEDFSQITD